MNYQNSNIPVAERVADLLRRMTDEEKIDQLCQVRGFQCWEKRNGKFVLQEDFARQSRNRSFGKIYGVLRSDWWTGRDWHNGVLPGEAAEVVNLLQRHTMENSRWGIPAIFLEEAPHGFTALGASVFPCGLGLGSMFDSELVEKVADTIGEESRRSGIRTLYAPILDIASDPRWSRVEECFGEDPFLVACYGERMVRGIVRKGVDTTLKHFVGGGATEGGHNGYSVHMGFFELQNRELKPWRTALAAGAGSVLCTYHDLDGEPVSGSYRILTEILRKQLGFNGYVAADAGAVEGLFERRLAASKHHAAARALEAGCDMESGKPSLHEMGLLFRDALAAKLITSSDLDRAAGRVLRVKFELGLFEHPYVETSAPCPRNEPLMLQCARESVILLKNRGMLPLHGVKRLAVIGPLADHAVYQLGDYAALPRPDDVTTLLAGVKTLAAKRNIEVEYAHGAAVRADDRTGFLATLECAEKADAIILAVGSCSTKFSGAVDPVTGAAVVATDAASDKDCGEGTDRCSLTFSGVQQELFQHLRTTGKPICVVVIAGRPLALESFKTAAEALLVAWYPGPLGGQAIAEVLFGEYNPAGRLSISIPYSAGQLPVFYNSILKNRPPYIDGTGESSYSFGFGLSYTHFEYSPPTISGREISVEVTNRGAMDGDEVVQFYLTALASSQQRPEFELCGFYRVRIKRGMTQKITHRITDEMLGIWQDDGSLSVEPGRFRIGVGGTLDTLQFVELAVG